MKHLFKMRFISFEFFMDQEMPNPPKKVLKKEMPADYKKKKKMGKERKRET